MCSQPMASHPSRPLCMDSDGILADGSMMELDSVEEVEALLLAARIKGTEPCWLRVSVQPRVAEVEVRPEAGK